MSVQSQHHYCTRCNQDIDGEDASKHRCEDKSKNKSPSTEKIDQPDIDQPLYAKGAVKKSSSKRLSHTDLSRISLCVKAIHPLAAIDHYQVD